LKWYRISLRGESGEGLKRWASEARGDFQSEFPLFARGRGSFNRKAPDCREIFRARSAYHGRIAEWLQLMTGDSTQSPGIFDATKFLRSRSRRWTSSWRRHRSRSRRGSWSRRSRGCSSCSRCWRDRSSRCRRSSGGWCRATSWRYTNEIDVLLMLSPALVEIVRS